MIPNCGEPSSAVGPPAAAAGQGRVGAAAPDPQCCAALPLQTCACGTRGGMAMGGRRVRRADPLAAERCPPPM